MPTTFSWIEKTITPATLYTDKTYRIFFRSNGGDLLNCYQSSVTAATPTTPYNLKSFWGTNGVMVISTNSGSFWQVHTSSDILFRFYAPTPSKITDLSGETGDNDGEIKLFWTAPGNDGTDGSAERYIIKYSTEQITNDQIWNNSITISSVPVPKPYGSQEQWIVSGLPKKVLFFAIRAINKETSNMSKISNSPGIKVKDAVPPGKVSDLRSVVGETEGKIKLIWSVPGEDNGITNPLEEGSSYKIQYSTFNIVYWSTANAQVTISTYGVTPGTTVNYTITGLNRGVTYYFRLWSVDEEQNYSLISNGTTQWAQVDNISPGKITGLTIKVTSNEGEIKLKWVATGDDLYVGTATLYTIKYASFGIHTESLWSKATDITTAPTLTNPPVPLVAGTTQEVIINNVPKGIWYFAIRAIDDYGNMSPISSTTISVSPIEIPPSIITTLVVSSTSVEGQIKLTWIAVGDDYSTGTASSYLIRYSSINSIDNELSWNSAYSVTLPPINATIPAPQQAGTSEELVLNNVPKGWNNFAIRVVDERNNMSGISNYQWRSATEVLPGKITTLVATSSDTAGIINLSWISPGDDNYEGTVSSYIIKCATVAIVNLSNSGGGSWQWERRYKINSSTTIEDYSLNFTVWYEPTMKYDFSDLRFTDDSVERKELSYWIENKTNYLQANIWVKIPKIYPGENYIYMYFGNYNAWFTSNIKNTFVFGDETFDTGWTFEQRFSTISFHQNYQRWENNIPTPHLKYSMNKNGISYDTYDSYPSANNGSAETPNFVFNENCDLELNFQSWNNTDDDKDNMAVYISSGYGWVLLWSKTDRADLWSKKTVGISGFSGTLKLKFTFDTVDESSNTYEGWYVDNIFVRKKVVPEPILGEYNTTQVKIIPFDSASTLSTIPDDLPKSAGSQEFRFAKDLSGDTTYYFAIKSFDERNNLSEMSNLGYAITIDTVPPGMVTDLMGEPGNFEGEIKLSWSFPGDNGYRKQFDKGEGRIQVSTWVGINWSTISAQYVEKFNIAPPPGSVVNHTISGLTIGVTYYIKIWFADEVPLWSEISNTATTWAQRDIVAPGIVTSFVGVTDEQVKLTWITPGDNNYFGDIVGGKYEISYTTNWVQWYFSTQTFSASQGQEQVLILTGLQPRVVHNFSIRVADEVDNWSSSTTCSVIPGSFFEVWSSTGAENTSQIVLGDYNNDGYLDILEGNFGTLDGFGEKNKIYRNNGNNNFELVWVSTLAENTRCVSWGDINNDGNLDFIEGNVGYLRVYSNNGNENFINIWSVDIGTPTSISLGDYDNDGFIDILVGRSGLSTQQNRIYRNKGNGTFELENSFNPISYYTKGVSWGDYNNDSYLDFVIVGISSNNIGIVSVYKNNGDRTFSQEKSLIGISTDPSSVAWGDYDNDGYLDILVGNLGKNQVYKNNNGTDFYFFWESLDVDNTYKVSWGDYDNDGYLDQLISNDGKNRIYRYNNFFNNFNLSWESVKLESTRTSEWGDVDNDGDLDIVFGNYGQKNYVYKSLEAEFSNSNFSPTVPTLFLSWFDSGKLNLRFSGFSDTETGISGLYYNIHITTSILPTDSIIVSGSFGSPLMGNFVRTGSEKNHILKNIIENTTYYWWVKTIDSGLRTSSWSIVQQICPNQSPGIVNHLSALTGANEGEIIFSWIAPGDDNYYGNIVGGKYEIQFSTDGSFSIYDKIIRSTDTILHSSQSIVLTGLINNTSYYIKVRMADEVPNWAEFSVIISTCSRDDYIPPGKITGFSANTGNVDSEIILIWTAPGDNNYTGNVSFGRWQIQYSTSTDFIPSDFVILTTSYIQAEKQTFSLTGLFPGTTFYIKIRASDERPNWSVWSDTVSTFAADLPLSVPTNLTAFTLGETDIFLEWTNPHPPEYFDDRSKYNIYYATYNFESKTDNFVSTKTVFHPSSNTVVTNLIAGVTYYFKLIATDLGDIGFGYFSSPLESELSTAIYTKTLFNPPTGFIAVNITTGSIQWAWKDNSLAEIGYKLKSSTGGILADISFNTTYYNEKNLVPNTSYYRYVVAYNDLVESLISETTARFTLANIPIFNSFTNISTYTIILNWSNNQNPLYTKYFVSVSTDINFTIFSETSNWTNSNNYLFTKLDANTTYYFIGKSQNEEFIESELTFFGSTCTLPTEPKIFYSGIFVSSTASSAKCGYEGRIATFSVKAIASHYYYYWGTDINAIPTTFWDGTEIIKQADSDGFWYFKVRSANYRNVYSVDITTFVINYSGTSPKLLSVSNAVSTNSANFSFDKMMNINVSTNTTYYSVYMSSSPEIILTITSITYISGNTFRIYTQEEHLQQSTYTIKITTTPPTVKDEYGNYIDTNFSTTTFLAFVSNVAPTVNYISLPTQTTDGSGKITVQVEINDENSDKCKLMVSYTTTTDLSVWNKCVISTATASYYDSDGILSIDGLEYQIGESENKQILTNISNQENKITFLFDTLELDSNYYNTVHTSITLTDGNFILSVLSEQFVIDKIAPYNIGITSFSEVLISSINVFQSSVTEIGVGLWQWQVRKSTDGINWIDLIWVSSENPTFYVTELLYNTTYYFSQKFKDTKGNISLWGAIGTTVTLCIEPSTASFSNIFISSIQANWSNNGNPPNKTKYLCEISQDNFENIITSSQTYNLYAIFDNLLPNTTYYFKVKAINHKNVPTKEIYLGTKVTLCSNPVVEGYETITSSAIHSVWTSSLPQNPQGTKYFVQISTNINFLPILNSSTTTNLKAIFTNLFPNTTYYFRISAINYENVTTDFVLFNATSTLCNSPVSVENLFSELSTHTIKVSWSNNFNPIWTKYFIETSSTSNFNSIITSSLTINTNYIFNGLVSNTSYYFRIRAINNNNISTPETEPYYILGTTATLSNVPIIVLRSSITLNTITWNWTSGGSEKEFYSYIIEPSTNSGWIKMTSWTVYNLLPNTEYTLNLKSRNVFDIETNVVSTKTYTAIEPVTDSEIYFVGSSSIGIRILNNLTNITSGQSGVYFYVTSGSGEIKESFWQKSLEFFCTDLTENTSYSYKIKSRNADNVETNFTTEISTYTLIAVPTLSKINIIASSSTFLVVNLSTPPNQSLGQTGCEIVNINTGSSTILTGQYSWQENQLLENTSYYYKARYKNVNGVWCEYSELKYKYTLCNIPKNVSVIVLSTQSVQLSVDSFSNDTIGNSGYEWTCIYDSGGGNSSTQRIFIDDNLLPNSAYQYRIRYKNAEGEFSDFVNTTTIWTFANVPVVPTEPFLDISIDSITVSWWPNNNSLITKYYVECSTTGENFSSIFANSGWIAKTTWTILGLTGNTSYYFRVKARNESLVETTTIFLGVKITPSIPPKNLCKLTATPQSIIWGWEASSGENEFFAEVWTTTTTPYSKLKTSGWINTTYWSTNNELLHNTSYQLFVKARNFGGIETTTSSIVSYTAMKYPTEAVWDYVGTSSISLRLLDVLNNLNLGLSGISFLSMSQGGGSDSRGWSVDPAHTDTGLNENSHYRYIIKTRNVIGEEVSQTLDITTYTLISNPTNNKLWVDIDISSSAFLVIRTSEPLHNATLGQAGVMIECVTTGKIYITTGSYVITDTGLLENTSYEYRIKYKNVNGIWSEYNTTVLRKYTKTRVPQNFVMNTELVAGAIFMSVEKFRNDRSELSRYYFDCIEGAGGYSVDTSANATLIAGLPPNEKYTYSVRYTNGDGVFSSSVTMSRYTLANDPDIPIISTYSTTTFNLKISPNDNPQNTKFIIYVSTYSNFSSSVSVQTDGTLSLIPFWQTYSSWGGDVGTNVVGLIPNTAYYVRVKARNEDNIETKYSEIVTVVTHSLPPQNVSLETLSSNAIELKWAHPIGGVAGYKIERSTDTNYWVQLTSSCIDTSFIDTNLILDTTYFYRIASYNLNYLLSQATTVSTYAQDNFPPGKVKDLTAVKGTSIGQIKLTWTYPGDDGYVGSVVDGAVEIKYSSSMVSNANSAEFMIYFTTSFSPSVSASIILSDLLPKTTYKFWIRTKDDIGHWSEYSDAVQIVTKYVASVISHYPQNNDAGIANTIIPTIYYDDYIDTMTISNAVKIFEIKNNLNQQINQEVNYRVFSLDNLEIKLIPVEVLNKNYKYKVTISSGVKDIFGNTIDQKIDFVFTTIMDYEKENKFALEEDKTVVEIYPNTLSQDAYLIIGKDPQSNQVDVKPQKIEIANDKITKVEDKTSLVNTMREFVLYDENKNVIKRNFKNKIKITIPYKDDDQDGYIDNLSKKVKEKTLKIYYLDEEDNVWIRIPDSVVDIEENTVSVYVQHFSVYMIVGEEDYSLDDAYAYPVPYRPNTDSSHKKITFTNLSREAVIKIYTINGELIKTIKEPQDDGIEDYKTSWEDVNVGSDVYIYIIENKKNKKTGKLIVVR